MNILQAAFAPIFLHQKLQSQIETSQKLRKTLLFEKFGHKMLMKLTVGVNFFNFLLAAFALADPKSAKKLTT